MSDEEKLSEEQLNIIENDSSIFLTRAVKQLSLAKLTIEEYKDFEEFLKQIDDVVVNIRTLNRKIFDKVGELREED